MSMNLQKIILGKRKEPLSGMEVKDLFKSPTTPESILTIYKGLKSQKINPNQILIEGIGSASKKEDLIPIALSLRYGADPNVYVKTGGVGNIHVLAFTYYRLSEPSQDSCILPPNQILINSIIMLLIASGSNPLMPIFKSCEQTFSLTDTVSGQNVISWLCEAGYNTILDQVDESLSNVKPESVTLIATFLNCPDMLKRDPKMEEVISSHADQILDNFAHLGNLESGLSMSIKYLNLHSFKIYTNLGASLDYWEVNNILLKMREYKTNGDILSLGALFEMLLYAVETGTVIDLYQFKLLECMDMDLAQTLACKYSEPYIKKVCKVCKGNVSSELQLIAYHLNLNPEYPKETICSEISKMAMTDPEALKRSAVARQERRISDTLSPIQSFICDLPHTLLRNKSMVENIYDYVDWDIAVYRDQHGVNWGFLRTKFSDLLENDKNPFTQEKLPTNFKDEMEMKREAHILLGLDKPVKVSETIDSLTKKDTISNEKTQNAVKRFYNMACMEGVNDDFIMRLSKSSLENALRNINIRTDLTSLSDDFARITFAVSAESKLRQNRYMVTDFFSNLRMNSTALLGSF